jgi:TolB-like protein/Tfp pilus assembly protein PilF
MPPKTDISQQQVRELLTRILDSESFEGVERLKRFLEFVVSEKLAGRGDQLKEFAVGEYAFGRGVSFDPRNDPIVRVQARRLRARLERYRETEGSKDEIYIELPKGGYVPSFRRREVPLPKQKTPTILLDRSSVVVMPFENGSNDVETEEICKGLATDIVHALVQIEGVSVHALLDKSSLTMQDLRAHPVAATAVTGRVQRRGDLIRVTLQVIDTASGSYLSSDSLDRPLMCDAHFALQDEVSSIVANRVREGVSQQGWTRRTAQTPKSLAAHNLYLQGRYHLDQRTEESLRLAASLFEKAIAEDTQFAKAHAGLADTYELMGHYGVIAPVEVWTKALSSASTAVLLDERSAEAHTSLAHVRSTQDWDWVGSEHEFRRALELDPRNATAHHWYATSCLAPMGRLDEALEEMQIAYALASLSSIITRDVASVLYYRREYDTALERCDQAIELNPYFSQAYWTLGFIQEHRQDYVEALAAFTRALELAPESPRSKGALGRILALTGKKKQALAILKELQDMEERRYVSPLLFASLHFALEQEDAGYERLKRAFQDRCFELLLINVDPKFDVFKKDPRFCKLAEQLSFPAVR